MAAKVNIGMPGLAFLPGNWTIEFAAVDPTTGADVAGVVVSDASIEAAIEGPRKNFDLDPPLLTHQPQDAEPGTSP